MGADSEMVTAAHALPAHGDEGGDAAPLIEQEEAAHGHDVEALSIDGAGYRGPLLRPLTDPEGLNLKVFTPPAQRIPLTAFGPEQFVWGEGHQALACPAGQTTTYHERNPNDTGVKFRFSKKRCGGCRLREQRLSNPQAKARTVIKNDYEAGYQAAPALAPPYAQVRREHPAIERELAELVRRHDWRRARSRGLSKVLRQALLTCMTVNLKRIAKLRTPAPDRQGTGSVRAEGLRTA